MCDGEALGRVEHERQEDDEALVGVEEANRPRRGAGRLADETLDLGRILVGLAARRRLGQRLEMALHLDDLGHAVDDRPLDLLGDRRAPRRAEAPREA